MLLSVRFVSQ